MKWMLITSLMLAGLQANAGPSSDQQIHEALRALPESLRDGAKVVGYNKSGERVTLKEGSNGMTCWADDPRPNPNTDDPYYVVCFTLGHFVADLLLLLHGWRQGSPPRKDLVAHHVFGILAGDRGPGHERWPGSRP